MELSTYQKGIITRALKAAAIETAAKDLKDTAKAQAIVALGLDSGKFETRAGLLTSQTRTELDFDLTELEKLVTAGTLPLSLLLQHVKAQASLKTVLGESLTERVTFKRPVTYWMLKPNETAKAEAAARLENLD
jgi:hypothetical protein